METEQHIDFSQWKARKESIKKAARKPLHYFLAAGLLVGAAGGVTETIRVKNGQFGQSSRVDSQSLVGRYPDVENIGATVLVAASAAVSVALLRRQRRNH